MEAPTVHVKQEKTTGATSSVTPTSVQNSVRPVPELARRTKRTKMEAPIVHVKHETTTGASSVNDPTTAKNSVRPVPKVAPQIKRVTMEAPIVRMKHEITTGASSAVAPTTVRNSLVARQTRQATTEAPTVRVKQEMTSGASSAVAPTAVLQASVAAVAEIEVVDPTTQLDAEATVITTGVPPVVPTGSEAEVAMTTTLATPSAANEMENRIEVEVRWVLWILSERNRARPAE